MDPLITHVESFLQHIRIERNYSPATEHSYRSALALFVQFLADSGASVTDKHSVNAFIRFLQGRGSSDVTIAHRLAVLKSFFSYLVAHGVVRKRALPPIEKFKTTRKIISIPSCRYPRSCHNNSREPVRANPALWSQLPLCS
jgi:integrase/recombinase XerD